MLLEQQENPNPPTLTPTRRAQLADVIQSGPVFRTARLSLHTPSGPSPDPNTTSLDEWLTLGVILERLLANQSNDVRVYQYYLPIYFWILRELSLHRANLAARKKTSRPFILGFCCPQGGGKTTMTTFMQTLLHASGNTVQIASLDDFYVTNPDQRKIAAKHHENRLLQYRGMPGTHDLALLNDTLDDLRKGRSVSIPRYDKTLFDGRGDRAGTENWKHIGGGETDVVLLEGWCMGFEPVPLDSLHDEDLVFVNDALAAFGGMYARLDGMMVVEIADMEWVYDWRLQAERDSREQGRAGLSDEEVVDFVGRFMPAYKQYSKPLYTRKEPLFPRHELHIQIDEQRRPVHRN